MVAHVLKAGGSSVSAPGCYSALRSIGTLLPLPARYFLGRLMCSLGFGNRLSSLKLHRLSVTVNLAPPPPVPPPPLGVGECP